MSFTIFRRIIPAGIVLALALTSWWLKDTTIPVKQTLDSSKRHDPDYYSENIVVYSMNDSGNPRYTMKADLIKHFPDNKSMQLTNPKIALHQNNKPGWTVESADGFVGSEGEEIFLSGGVIMQQIAVQHSDRQEAQNNVNRIKVTTQDLLIHPKDKYAETDKEVHLQDQNGTTQATGMKANMEDNHIQFLSDVRSSYAKP